MAETPPFVHLHVHTHYSLLDGAARLEPLLKRAKELGMEALAITDHGAMYGAIEFYETAQKVGIKPILGVEAYMAPRGRQDRDAKLDSKAYHQLLLAESYEGYKNLIKLTSEAYINGFYYKPRIDKDLLRQHSKGLIATSGCFNGEIPRKLEISYENGKKALEEYLDIFGKDNFFIELQDRPEYPESKKIDEMLIKLAREYGLDLICTNDVHYINREDAEAQDVLVCVGLGKTVNDPNRLNMRESDLHLASPETMAQKFSHLPEALANTVKIAERCNVTIPMGENILPVYPLPEGTTDRMYLRQLCQEGIKRRYGFDYVIQANHADGELLPSPMNDPAIPLEERVKARVEYELSVIEKMGFESYFLIVQDFIMWAKSKGIMIGPGRGSAAGSIVSYLTGIINLDPLKYNLIFERFLNPERIGMPDIDNDIEDARRDEVIQYVRERYGSERVAQIITFGTMAARNAIRDVGRVLGVSYNECDYLAKLIPSGPGGLTIAQALEQIEDLKNLYNGNEQLRHLLDIASKLEGVARHTSIHAAGVVITKDPITEYAPLQRAVKDDNAIVTQYAMKEVDHIGLLKIDFLGLSNLNIIQQALRVIRKTRGVEIDLDTLPTDDEESYKLLSRTETTGVFQLECLSGDTLVSNTTIRDLCHKRNKDVLEAIYLDEGKVHRSRILDVASSGKKELFALVADNGWHIKASADHHFLTPEGWKTLGELIVGDTILIKSKAKHLVYNVCQTCGKQISGQKEGGSMFCYACSATYYSNPSKPQSRLNIRNSRLKFYAQGGKPWNLGLTADTCPTLQATGKKISKSLMGRSWEDPYGSEKAESLREHLSHMMSGSGNPMFGCAPHHRKGGFRPDIGHYVRSNWEADFARILKLFKLDYQYEPHTFALQQENGQTIHYTPDFYVPEQDAYYEIKGWMRPLDQEKINLFQSQYPQHKLILISATQFAEFSLRYKDMVAWECPKIPTGFEFVAIKEIISVGEEEAYDIALKVPGNNYVANGFVVHNSGGMKRYLKELQPTTFEDILSMVALYRPGPMDAIPDFIEAKHGRKAITYLHPILEPILSSTYGVIVTQDQVLEIARKFAGFSYAEADILRKAVGKKIKKLLDEQRDKFINGAVKTNQSQGVTLKLAEQVWDFVEPFARYGFNRAHAACYAMIAYQTAYLKAHYPVEFMAALLTSDIHNLDRVGIEIAECRERDIEVLPPDVNESYVEFGTVFYADDGRPRNGRNHDAYIRFGLGAIKNVGIQPAEAIVEERKRNGKYASLTDFITRTSSSVNKKVLENLAMAGALDSLAERQSVLINMDRILTFIGHLNKHQNTNQITLFDEAQDSAVSFTLDLDPCEPAPSQTRLAWERDLLGIYLSEHPLQPVFDFLPADRIPLRELANQSEGQRVKVAGCVMNIRTILTKNSQNMAFVTLEDETSNCELIVFPKIWKEKESVLQPGKPVVVEGKVSRKNANGTEELTSKILADTCVEVTASSAKRPRKASKVTLSIPPNGDRSLLNSIKENLEAYPGNLPVTLLIPTMEGDQPLNIQHKVEYCEQLHSRLSYLLGPDNVLWN